VYEHIDPLFKDAVRHDPAGICCLCASCHLAVTSGQRSKASVRRKYLELQVMEANQVSPPMRPLDFHDGTAELSIGGTVYTPGAKTLLRHHGKNLIRVEPGGKGEPGKITAFFIDSEGRPVLWLKDNVWIGALENWDIEVTGPRLVVRRKLGEISLQLKLEPPGRIVIERLDMRFGNYHLLATESGYAVGFGLGGDVFHWVSADFNILHWEPQNAAIEIIKFEEIEPLDNKYFGTGQGMATKNRMTVFQTNVGMLDKVSAIVLASGCVKFAVRSYLVETRTLKDKRRMLQKSGPGGDSAMPPNSVPKTVSD